MQINITKFKTHCLRLLEEVHSTGEELVIHRNGKPLVRVIPEKPERPWMALRHRGRLVGDPFEPVIEQEHEN